MQTQTVCLSCEFNQKVVLLVVMDGTWSGCQSYAQLLEELYAAHHQSGLEVALAFCTDDAGRDDEASLLAFADGFKNYLDLSYLVGIDAGCNETGTYHEALPLSMIIDQQKTVRFKQEGDTPDMERLGYYISEKLPP